MKPLINAIHEIIMQFREGRLVLPALPAIVQKVEAIISDPDFSTRDLVDALNQDATLSVKLLSVVNTAAFRGTGKITTINSAVTRLGVTETRNIVHAIANRSVYTIQAPRLRSIMQRLWLHSLAAAVCSQEIAARLEIKDRERYFLLGLVHDIGKPLLVKALSDIYTGDDLPDENELLTGIQEVHTYMGSVILQRGTFKADAVHAAAYHEDGQIEKKPETPVLVVNLANHLTRHIGYSLFTDNAPASSLTSAQRLRISPAACEQICTRAAQIIQDAAQAFS